MKRAARFALVWLAACQGRNVVAGSTVGVAGAPSAPSAAADVPLEPLSAPHGGPIELVALTDRGDAALTADAFAEIRLWPVLDGTREPIVVRGPAPAQLALGRDDGGLFAAILDHAGDVELLRLDARGRVRGWARLPPQPPIEQVVAIRGGVLIRRSDHSIERFDSRGTAKGRLVPDAGQRVVSLAVRRDLALAGIAERDQHRAGSVRWIEPGSALAWGPPVALPEPLSDLAISPGGRRIAGLAVDDVSQEAIANIVELEPHPAVAVTLALSAHPAGRRPRQRRQRVAAPNIGFLTDDTVAFARPGELIWATASAGRPWVLQPHAIPLGPGIAIGDRAAGASGATLQLSDPRSDSFLGYRFVGAAEPATVDQFRDGHGVVLEVLGGLLWLDRLLRAHPATLDPELNDLALVLDDHHVLVTPLAPGPHLQKRIIIRDVTTSTGIAIATLAGVTAVRYDPGTRVLAIASSDGIVRYRLAFDPIDATPLRTLAGAGPQESFHLTDPALANGVVAVVENDPARTHALIYRLDGGEGGPPLEPQVLALVGPLVAVDRAGTIYVAADGLQIYRDRRLTSQRLQGISDLAVISHDGGGFAVGHAGTVTVFDASGAERWHRAVWRAGPVAWSRDDHTVFVATGGGGAISFDATTGTPLAMRCGWAFGRFDHELVVVTDAPSACAATLASPIR